MKKSLIALAAMAVAGTAFAQSSVTLYGLLDIGYGGKDWSDNAGDSKTRGIQDGAIAGSRFGFRGTEDLGGGLRASFVIEQGISPTSSRLTGQRTATSGHQIDVNVPGVTGSWGLSGRSATSLNRQSFVALGGGFGEVRLGYQYTNSYELSSLAGFNIGSEGVHGGDTSHTYGQANVGGSRANGITYISPRIAGGLTVRLQYGAGINQNEYGSDVDGYRDEERLGIMAQYAAGPLNVAVAYTTYKTETEAGTATTPVFGAAAPSNTAKLTQIGASYDFGVARVAGTYNMGNTGDVQDRDLNAWQLGVRVPFGAAALIATYGAGTTEDPANVEINDHTQWQLALTYSLSKRTTAYAYYGETKDEGTAGVDKKTNYIVGVIHTF